MTLDCRITSPQGLCQYINVVLNALISHFQKLLMWLSVWSVAVSQTVTVATACHAVIRYYFWYCYTALECGFLILIASFFLTQLKRRSFMFPLCVPCRFPPLLTTVTLRLLRTTTRSFAVSVYLVQKLLFLPFLDDNRCQLYYWSKYLEWRGDASKEHLFFLWGLQEQKRIDCYRYCVRIRVLY